MQLSLTVSTQSHQLEAIKLACLGKIFVVHIPETDGCRFGDWHPSIGISTASVRGKRPGTYPWNPQAPSATPSSAMENMEPGSPRLYSNFTLTRPSVPASICLAHWGQNSRIYWMAWRHPGCKVKFGSGLRGRGRADEHHGESKAESCLLHIKSPLVLYLVRSQSSIYRSRLTC